MNFSLNGSLPYKTLRFSGYELTPDQTHARLWFPQMPGQPQTTLNAEVISPNGQSKTHTLKRNLLPGGDPYWRSEETIPVGSLYKVEHLPLDNTLTELHQGQRYNVVSPLQGRISDKTGDPLLHLYPSAAMTDEQLSDYDQTLQALYQTEKSGAKGSEARNRALYDALPHVFQPMNADPRGLLKAPGIARNMGFKQLLLNPLTGEDRQLLSSSHGYWTTNPYALNKRLPDRQALNRFLMACSRNGVKPYFDAALSSMGLNSIPFLSILYDGPQSPYWPWFQWNSPARPGFLPKEADGYHPIQLGVLPTRQSGPKDYREIDFNAFDIRIDNNPLNKTDYKSLQPSWVELFDPRLEGKTLRNLEKPIVHSKDSVLKYRFPVTAEEARHKLNQIDQKKTEYKAAKTRIQDSALTDDLKKAEFNELKAHFDQECKKLLLNWRNFSLVKPSQDGLPKKFRGQVDIAQMNLSDPDATRHLMGSMGYWTREVQNHYVESLGRALTKQMQHGGNPTEWLRSITLSPEELSQVQKNPEVLPGHKLLAPPTAEEEKSLNGSALTEFLPEHRTKLLEKQQSAVPAPQALAQQMLTHTPLAALPLPPMLLRLLIAPGLQAALSASSEEALAALHEDDEEENQSSRQVVSSAINKPEAPSWLNRFILKSGARKIAENAAAPLNATGINALRPPKKGETFERVLSQKLKAAMALLEPQQQQRLTYQTVQNLLSDKLGKSLFLTLLTGDPNAVDAEELTSHIENTLPPSLLTMNPMSAAANLPAFLTQRLKALPPQRIVDWLKTERLDELDPAALALAQTVMDHRELGLNWRLDAADQIINLDDLRNRNRMLPQSKIFAKAMERVQHLWQQAVGPVRDIFPKAQVIAELTQLAPFSGGGSDPTLSQAAQRQFFEGTTTSAAQGKSSPIFDSMLNYDVIFNNSKKLFNGPPEPYKYGESLGISDFLSNVGQQAQALPPSALASLFNMTATHDSGTTAHSLLHNPALFHMDQFPWRGLKDDMNDVFHELLTKASMAPQRKLLEEGGMTNLPHILGMLRHRADQWYAEDMQHQGQDGPEFNTTKGVMNAFNVERKQQPYDRQGQVINRNIPPQQQLQQQMITDLFAQHKNKLDLGLTPDQEKLLEKVLIQRMGEPSETRGLRAVLTNTIESAPSSDIPPSFKPLFYDALNTALGEDRKHPGWVQHLGYQPLPHSLATIWSKLPAGWETTVFGDLPAETQTKQVKQLKQQILTLAMKPALEKQERLIALQQVMPGTPVMYYADLYGQTGGELENNRFQQSRTPFHTDWLDPAKRPEKVQERQFNQSIQRYIQLRERFPALKNGLMLKTIPDSPSDRQKLDESGIIPILRDNGKQQVLALINTGKPSVTGNPANPIDYWNLTRAENGDPDTIYPIPKLQQPVAHNTAVDLSAAQIPIGTQYRSVPLESWQKPQAYVVALAPDGKRLLVKDSPTLYNANRQPVLKSSHQVQTDQLGIDIRVMEFLERV